MVRVHYDFGFRVLNILRVGLGLKVGKLVLPQNKSSPRQP